MILVDYWVAKECKKPHYGMCYKCGKCGRKFNAFGVMEDDGGTTEEGEEE